MAYGAVNFTNQFLIAMPGMADDQFAGAVVYLCEHTEHGALGLVINRPIDIKLKNLFEKVELSLTRDDLADLAVPLVPQLVEQQRARFLERWKEAMALTEGATLPEAAQDRALTEATAFAKSMEQLANLSRDADAAQLLEHVFRNNGINVMNKTRAEKVVNTGSGVEVTLADGSILKGSHCLMAVGSIPNTAGLGLEEAGVVLTESGHIQVNKVARTSRANVYAVGDCSTFLPLASVSAMQGRTAVFHTMGDVATPTEVRNVASNVFTAPEIASVGWMEQDIKDGKVNGFVEKIDLNSNPRAKMQGIDFGFIKLICSTGGTVIGGVIVAPRASDLIYSIAIAIENRLTADELARTFTVYPSLSETISNAARALHKPNV